MAGNFLDDLVDSLSDDDTSSGDNSETPKEEEAFVDAEDFMRRAVQMQMSTPQQKITIDSGSFDDVSRNVSPENPEDKVDYYRRMVQMHEMMRSAGYESVTQLTEEDADGDKQDLQDPSSKSLQVCSEFIKSGDCKSGLGCRFVHEGAFRKGGSTELEDEVNVDPEDFIRRALQLRQGKQKNSRKDAARAASSSTMLSLLRGW